MSTYALRATLRPAAQRTDYRKPSLYRTEVLRDTIQPFPTFSEAFVNALADLSE